MERFHIAADGRAFVEFDGWIDGPTHVDVQSGYLEGDQYDPYVSIGGSATFEDGEKVSEQVNPDAKPAYKAYRVSDHAKVHVRKEDIDSIEYFETAPNV